MKNTSALSQGLQGFKQLAQLRDLEMPFTAKFVMMHYIQTGRFSENLYVGVADGEKVIFTDLPEF